MHAKSWMSGHIALLSMFLSSTYHVYGYAHQEDLITFRSTQLPCKPELSGHWPFATLLCSTMKLVV